MKLEYNVQELKHKLQKYLIEDRKNYDRIVEESGAKESRELYLDDLQQKEKVIEEWFEKWEGVDVVESLTVFSPVRKIKKGWFFDKEITENKLTVKNVEDLPNLPDGICWEYDRYSRYTNDLLYSRKLETYQLIERLPSTTHVFRIIHVKWAVMVQEGFTYEDCEHIENDLILKICTDTLPYLKAKAYKEPTNVGKLLDKILLAEKHGCVTVVLEDKDLDVLMGIE